MTSKIGSLAYNVLAALTACAHVATEIERNKRQPVTRPLRRPATMVTDTRVRPAVRRIRATDLTLSQAVDRSFSQVVLGDLSPQAMARIQELADSRHLNRGYGSKWYRFDLEVVIQGREIRVTTASARIARTWTEMFTAIAAGERVALL